MICLYESQQGPRQAEISILPLPTPSPLRFMPLLSSHTVSHTHLAVFTWSLSLSNCCLPSISFPFSVSVSLALLLSISPPQRHPPLLFPISSFLHQIKGLARASTSHSISDFFTYLWAPCLQTATLSTLT